jgi:CO/xanthine dehydrogenase Mo-binding subunit
MSRQITNNIGARIPRAEARSLVTGQEVFLDDFELPGTLHGRILRSPHAHARILAIDTSAAVRLPGLRAVITAQDTPKIPFCQMPITPNKLPLCDKKVRCVGDEVAAVAAVDPETAEEGLGLIKVEYEPLDSVFDLHDAMAEGAPILYDDCPDNIAMRFARKFGNPDEAMGRADHIFEDEFVLPRVASCSMETHGCVAWWRSDGQLIIYDSTQSINNVREALSVSLDMPLHQIRVISLALGGAFGNKSALLPLEPIAAILSRKTGAPVKIIHSRKEDFIASRTRYAMHIRLRTGVTKEGKLIARQARIITENGAYNNKAPGITAVTCSRIGNLYRVPHSSTEAVIVYTNNQYGGALRGWGGPQAHFAIESQMDMIAHELGVDPVELRIKNANQEGDVTPWGWKITSCGLKQCLKQAAASFTNNFTDSSPRVARAWGLAAGIHTGAGSAGAHGSANFEEVFLAVHPDGSANLAVGVVDMGQGSHTVLAQIVGQELGLPAELVKVTTPPSDQAPRTMGPWGSRVTFIAGKAATQAARSARKQILELAMQHFQIETKHELFISNGIVQVRGLKHLSVKLGELLEGTFKKTGTLVSASAIYNPPATTAPDKTTGYGNPSPAYSFGAHAAEVEVEMDTGKVKVLNVVAVHDVGKAINPLLLEGQIQGGVAMGIGYCLFEDLRLEGGITKNDSFAGYKIINSSEVPNVTCMLVETNDPEGPFGAKGVAEMAIVPTAPAIANAIFNATGVRIKELPITAEKILAALKQQELDNGQG